MVCRVLRWSLCVGIAMMALIQPGAVFAYNVGSGSSGTGPTGVAAGTPFTFVATFLQPDGTPVPAGVGVTFSQQNGPGTAALPARQLRINGQWQGVALAASTCQATFNPVTTVTDSSGRAATTVTLPSGCPGQYVLAATLAGGGTITFTVVETGGFPNTTADPARGLSWRVVAGSVLLLIALAAGAVRIRSLLGSRWS